MTIDCIIWAVTGVYVGVIIGMFLMLCKVERDIDSLYDTAFDSGVAYEKETQQIAELIRENEPGVIRMPMYTMTVSSEQARAIDKAVELLLRLKIGQFEEIPWAVRGCDHPEEFCLKRDEAKPYLDALRNIYGAQKDIEWHRLYDLHQVIRKAIHDAEHPGTTGVDSYPVVCTSGERLAKMEVVKG